MSDCSSALSCMRDKWACSRRLVLTWGSLNLGLVSLWGTFWASYGGKQQTFSPTEQTMQAALLAVTPQDTAVPCISDTAGSSVPRRCRSPAAAGCPRGA